MFCTGNTGTCESVVTILSIHETPKNLTMPQLTYATRPNPCRYGPTSAHTRLRPCQTCGKTNRTMFPMFYHGTSIETHNLRAFKKAPRCESIQSTHVWRTSDASMLVQSGLLLHLLPVRSAAVNVNHLDTAGLVGSDGRSPSQGLTNPIGHVQCPKRGTWRGDEHEEASVWHGGTHPRP